MSLNKSFLNAFAKQEFNPSEWSTYGEPYTLKEVWEALRPGVFEKITSAEVIVARFPDGSSRKKIAVSVEGEARPLEYTLGKNTLLCEGDLVDPASITCQELRKLGADPIVRCDGKVKAA